jgi:hypothetical protein
MVHTTKISKVVVCYFGYKSFGFCVGASFGTKYQHLHFIFWVCFGREGVREGEEWGVGRGGGNAFFGFGRKRIVGIRVWWEWEGAWEGANLWNLCEGEMTFSLQDLANICGEFMRLW